MTEDPSSRQSKPGSDRAPHRSWLIVSDLDGTLLDHYDYSHEPVDPLLRALDEASVPVVLNSSKTIPEMLALRQELGNRHPFICENGSAILIPTDYFASPPPGASPEPGNTGMLILETGSPRDELVRYLQADAIKHGAPYLAFSQASSADIVAATGLSATQAELARQRRYSEPLLWRGTDDEREAFRERARDAGLATLQGGRFLHLQGPTDKGRATTVLRRCYEKDRGAHLALICAGDSENDLDMLAVADVAVIIRAADRPPPQLASTARRQVLESHAEGPLGWREVIGELVFPDSTERQR